jgi:hypothetical protein
MSRVSNFTVFVVKIYRLCEAREQERSELCSRPGGCLPASVQGQLFVARIAVHFAAPLEAAVAGVRFLDLLGVVAAAAAQQIAPTYACAAAVAHAALRAQRPCFLVALAKVGRLLRIHLKCRSDDTPDVFLNLFS